MLGLAIAGWALLRFATWHDPFPAEVSTPVSVIAQVPSAMSPRRAAIEGTAERLPVTEDLHEAGPPFLGTPAAGSAVTGPRYLTHTIKAGFTLTGSPQSPPPRKAPTRSVAPTTELAAFDSTAVLTVLPAEQSVGIPAASGVLRPLAPLLPQRRQPASRWSGDGWVLLRDDTTTAITSGRGSYGRSQLGAVLRYRLAPDAARQPSLFVRAVAALQGAVQRDVALGASLRPVPAIPVVIAAEARASQTATGTEIRPAAFAYTQVPPARLPLGLQATAYAQAGYVDGSFATAFVDAQARIDRSFKSVGNGIDLRLGAGNWGGAQQGAARLDVGPRAAVTFRLGEGRGEVAADWRFRVAGDAEPGSGPAITFSTGF